MRNSETGSDLLFKNKRLLFSRTIWYCFYLVFLLFCNLKIPKQGIKMQIFFLNGLWRLLKNGHLPVKLHSSAPPPPHRVQTQLLRSFHLSPFTLQKNLKRFRALHLLNGLSTQKTMVWKVGKDQRQCFCL